MPNFEISDKLYDQLNRLAQDKGLTVEQLLSQQFADAPSETPADSARKLDARYAVPYMLYIFDRRLGYNTFVNRYTRNFFSKTLAEIQEWGAQLYIETLHPDDLAQLAAFQHQWDAAADDDVFIKEYRMRRADGEYRWLRSYETILERDADGTPTQIIGSAIDITEEKQREDALRESEARYRAVAENFPNGSLLLYDRDLRYTLVDGNNLRDIGITNDDLLGKRLRDVFPPEHYERDEPALIAALRGETTTSVLPFAGGYFQVTTLPVKDDEGNIISGMVISQDVTALKQAELRQRDLNSQLQLAIETAKLGIWQFDPQTETLSWNEQQHAIYGVLPGEFCSNLEDWRGYVHPDDRPAVDASFAEVLSGADVFDSRYRIIRPDGEVRHINGSGIALRGDDGNITRLIGINLDVTDYERSKRELAISEARYRTLFNAFVNPVIVYDEQARIVIGNQSAIDGLGNDPGKIIGQPLGTFLPEKQAITVERIAQVLATGEPLYVEDRLEIDGEDHWYWSVMQPVTDDNGVKRLVQVISYDMTDRKKAEMLEAERAELTRQLKQEQALTKARARMFSIVAHEFRTPLTVIRTSNDLLQHYADRISDEMRQEKLTGIANQVRQLDQMIDEISLLSQANSGFLQYHPEPTDLHAFCEGLVNELSDATHKHRLAVNVNTTERKVMLDRKLMHHALSNLISNAIKYSPKGGSISLKVSQVDNTLSFSVTDEGIGIPAEDLKHLFEPFARASNVGRIRGTGLGLSIVKEIARQHSGIVEVRSEIGRGSTFTVSLPVRVGVS